MLSLATASSNAYLAGKNIFAGAGATCPAIIKLTGSTDTA
jgi:hypothetical protein